jgi:hypothetical protein
MSIAINILASQHPRCGKETRMSMIGLQVCENIIENKKIKNYILQEHKQYVTRKHEEQRHIFINKILKISFIFLICFYVYWILHVIHGSYILYKNDRMCYVECLQTHHWYNELLLTDDFGHSNIYYSSIATNEKGNYYHCVYDNNNLLKLSASSIIWYYISTFILSAIISLFGSYIYLFNCEE